MGCIKSKKKIVDLCDVSNVGNNFNINNNPTSSNSSNDMGNIFRTRAIRLHPEMPMKGHLELTPREIVFLPQGSNSGGSDNGPVMWALQHLRRYGVNGETFSFEAGRRCMTGPGIFTFRLPDADTLYQLFQRYINDVTTLTDDMFQFHGQSLDNANFLRAHTNNYLEPTSAQRTAARNEYFGSNSPMSMELDSPDSLPSLSFGTANEVVHFSPNSRQQIQAAAEQLTQQHVTAGNIYSERPLGSQQQRVACEHNYINNNRSDCSIGGMESGTASAFSTISRKLMVRRSSMDMPPKECAPMLTPTTPTLRLYANVEQWADGQLSVTNTDFCYVN